MLYSDPLSLLFPYTTLFRSPLKNGQYFSLRVNHLVCGQCIYLLITLEIKVEIQWRQSLSPLKQEIMRSEEHTSELQSRGHLVCRLLLEKKKSYSVIIYRDIT